MLVCSMNNVRVHALNGTVLFEPPGTSFTVNINLVRDRYRYNQCFVVFFDHWKQLICGVFQSTTQIV